MGSHRLIVNSSTIVSDYQTAADKDGVRNPIYSLFYQMTRISRERGALAHDDRLDALAIGVQFFVESMAKDAAVAAIKVTVNGKVFDGDEVAQGRISRAVAAAESAGVSAYQWKLADNSVAAVSLDELKQAQALAFQAQSELWV